MSKHSFEGEGRYLGFRTIFSTYPELPEEFEVKFAYLSTHTMEREIYDWIKKQRRRDKVVSVEFINCIPDQSEWKDLYADQLIINTRQFVAVPEGYIIKIEMFDDEDNDEEKLRLIGLANKFAHKYEHEVWLMPRRFKEFEWMLDYLSDLHDNIRFMPPVHEILRLP